MTNREDNASSSDEGDTYSSALPGESFPAANSEDNLIAAEERVNNCAPGGQDSDDTEDDEACSEEELLKRLSQGQQRMEQIKRMLVNQRGFIVESLKRMATANSAGAGAAQSSPRNDSCANCRPSRKSSGANPPNPIPDERDRTIGRVVAVQPDTQQVSHFSQNGGSTSSPPATATESNKTCPMCEASFPSSVTQEDFELHVVEHFNFEESETLRYVPPSTLPPNSADHMSVVANPESGHKQPH